MTKEEQEIYNQELKSKWDNAAVKAQQLLDFESVKEQQRIALTTLLKNRSLFTELKRILPLL